jgi:acetylglutamate kinase
MTDVAGIYRHYPDPDSVIREISATDLVVLQESFVAGMIPKSQAAISALAAGAKKVRIIDGREPSNLTAALSGLGGTVVFA